MGLFAKWDVVCSRSHNYDIIPHDTTNWIRTYILKGHQSWIASLAFSPSNHQLLSGSATRKHGGLKHLFIIRDFVEVLGSITWKPGALEFVAITANISTRI